MDAGTSSGGGRQRPGPWPPRLEPFVPNTDHNPRELKSWAKRTGFNPNFSGETTASAASIAIERGQRENNSGTDLGGDGGLNLEPCLVGSRRKAPPPEIEPMLGRRGAGIEISPAPRANEDAGRLGLKEKMGIVVEPAVVGSKDVGKGNGNGPVLMPKNEALSSGDGRGKGGRVVAVVSAGKEEEETKKDIEKGERDVGMDAFLDSPGEAGMPLYRPPGFKYGIFENPGYGPSIFYGLQYYFSLAGSLVFIPLIIVPAMGGTDEDMATVISTMLLVSGITTIMHSFVGSRLPLVQGSSFVYLAPALVIINSEEFRNLSENKFKHIMRELQGAIIVGSIFQTIMGYSGLMSLLLRLINPVVVAPTVAAVGLAFFSYGFPQAGACAEISLPLILLVLIFTLYLRRISIFGHHIFLVYAVPLSVAIVWVYAVFLTTGGAYNYKGCSSNIPSSNILLDACKKHADTMKHCRTDASSAWRTAAWVRIPYPFQWGSPAFHFRTSLVMVIVSLVASVDSIGTYHATSVLVNLKPPSPGIVSRGIGLEGCSSILAGLWGTGTGSTTLTENVHTIDATKMASRRPIQLGAALMILFSFVGKIGALLASIPLALAAAVLCFTWALVVALGLSTLQYTQTASSRNIIIVGATLFLSLSIPAYFQQYAPNSSLILPSYFVPYSAASNGPIRLGSKGLNYAMNAVLSLNMVVAFVVAFVLDNTVPGSRQERGVYIWSSSRSTEVDPCSLEPYMLPRKIRGCFRWARWVGS